MSNDNPVAPVAAIIGCGLIGRSWAIVFARAGFKVQLYDSRSDAARDAKAGILQQLPLLEMNDLLQGTAADTVAARIHVSASLQEALCGAGHVQENAPEILSVKQALFAEIDRYATTSAIIASSTSALIPSSFLEGLPGAHRCLVAHPLNPPHLVPAVELVPGPETAEAVMRQAVKLYRQVGQQPIVLHREVEGFVMNRLQGALLEEAFRLIDDGIVSATDIDIALKNGLALRWSFMGPVETIDLNAPGGLLDYVERYASAYTAIAQSANWRVEWRGEFAKRLHQARREQLPADQLASRCAWRDRQLMQLAVHKRARHDADGD